jgi:hypothetical protein
MAAWDRIGDRGTRGAFRAFPPGPAFLAGFALGGSLGLSMAGSGRRDEAHALFPSRDGMGGGTGPTAASLRRIQGLLGEIGALARVRGPARRMGGASGPAAAAAELEEGFGSRHFPIPSREPPGETRRIPDRIRYVQERARPGWTAGLAAGLAALAALGFALSRRK